MPELRIDFGAIEDGALALMNGTTTDLSLPPLANALREEFDRRTQPDPEPPRTRLLLKLDNATSVDLVIANGMMRGVLVWLEYHNWSGAIAAFGRVLELLEHELSQQVIDRVGPKMPPGLLN